MSIADKRFVKIVWHDAQDEGRAWVPAEDLQPFTEELCVVTSWGWVVGETKKYITLAADYVHDGDFGRVTKIPKPWIQAVELFETKGKPCPVTKNASSSGNAKNTKKGRLVA